MRLCLLAGGRSRRFGGDKALATHRGRNAFARLASLADDLGLEGRVLGRKHDPTAMPAGLGCLPDLRPDEGPLAGLEAAFAERRDAILVMACDLPLFDAEALRWLRERLADRPSADAVIPEIDGRLQPATAGYRPGCAGTVTDMLDRDRRSLHALVDATRAEVVPVPGELAGRFASFDRVAEWPEE